VRASGSLPQPYQGEPGTATLEAYRIIAVTNTADAGEGSLRNAIDIANEHCTPGPCKIVFEIPAPVPAEGWFTIIPESPLPAITAERVFIDGKWQKSITGDTMPNAPVIALDMHRAHSGLTLASSCDGVLQGIAIGNADADQALRYFLNRPCSPKSYYFNPDRHFITESHFGADPAGNPWPNLRGIVADNAMGSITKSVISNNVRSGVWMYEGSWLTLSENRIERNGASGIFLGPRTEWSTVQWNTINDNAEMGVAVANTALEVDIRQNSMRNNGGLGIDWGLDGVSPNDGDDTNKPTNAPTLLSATYNPVSNQTLVTYRIHSTPLRSWGNGLTDFYVNDSPDGDGEKYIGAQTYPSEPGARPTIR